MHLDYFLRFADAQAVTTTAISENVIDTARLTLSPTTADLGAGNTLYLVVSTQTTATDVSSDATLTITLESDDTVGLDSSPTVHFSSGALAFATFATAGTRLVALKLPLGDYQRYLGLRFTIASGPLTAGKFDAFLTHDVQAFKAYASNSVITG